MIQLGKLPRNLGTSGISVSAPRFSGILDAIGAPSAAAFSLQNLSFDGRNEPVVRIRRSSDDAERNFTVREIDNGFLLFWVTDGDANANGHVRTWYDQSGLDRHATQTAALSQPLLVENGELVTEKGKPAIKFNDEGAPSQWLGLPTAINSLLSNSSSVAYSMKGRIEGRNSVSGFGNLFGNIRGSFLFYIGSASLGVHHRTNQIASVNQVSNDDPSFGSLNTSQSSSYPIALSHAALIDPSSGRLALYANGEKVSEKLDLNEGDYPMNIEASNQIRIMAGEANRNFRGRVSQAIMFIGVNDDAIFKRITK